MIVVSDNGIRARVDFPGCDLVLSFEALLQLPEGAEIAIAEYAPRPEDKAYAAIAGARALVARGVLREAKREDSP